MEREFHIIIAKVVEKVSAVLADANDTEILGVRTGEAMLQIERIAYDLNGRPVELRTMWARNDTYYLSEFA